MARSGHPPAAASGSKQSLFAFFGVEVVVVGGILVFLAGNVLVELLFDDLVYVGVFGLVVRVLAFVKDGDFIALLLVVVVGVIVV